MKEQIRRMIITEPDQVRRRLLGPYGGRSIITGKRRPYTGAELRAIRKEKGVGRPPAVNLGRVHGSP